VTTALKRAAPCVPELRIASPGDSEFAFAARKAAFARYAELAGGWREAEELQLHERRFNPREYRIISLSGVDVGVIAAHIEPDHMKLNQLFILPEYQSKGIGYACMRLVFEEARHLGLPIRLRVLKVNPRALAFYLRIGFSAAGETDTHFLLSWHALPTLPSE